MYCNIYSPIKPLTKNVLLLRKDQSEPPRLPAVLFARMKEDARVEQSLREGELGFCCLLICGLS